MGALHLPSKRLKRQDGLYVLAFLLPPLAVKLAGESRFVFLNVLLTICFWVPGVIHALWILARHAAEVRQSEGPLLAAMRNHIRR